MTLAVRLCLLDVEDLVLRCICRAVSSLFERHVHGSSKAHHVGLGNSSVDLPCCECDERRVRNEGKCIPLPHDCVRRSVRTIRQENKAQGAGSGVSIRMSSGCRSIPLNERILDNNTEEQG